MPRMGGFELQQAIAGTILDRPIVFITGHGDEAIRARALSSGAADLLFKPIDVSVLVEAVERALAREARAHRGHRIVEPGRRESMSRKWTAEFLGTAGSCWEAAAAPCWRRPSRAWASVCSASPSPLASPC